MSSEYFTFSTPFARNTLARAEALNAIFTALEASLANIPSSTLLLEDRITFAADTGVVNAYIVDLATAPPSGYVDGLTVHFKTANANTGAATINVNSLGVKQIRDFNGNVLEAGAIPAGGIVTVRYDGSFFRLNTVATSVIPQDESVTTGKIAADAVTTDKIAAGAVGTSDLTNGAVTVAKIGDAQVAALASLAGGASKLPYFTSTSAMSQIDFPVDSRTFISAANFTAMRAALGVALGSDVQAWSANLDTVSGWTLAPLNDIQGISQAAGGLIKTNGANYVALAKGTAGHFLRTNAAGTDIEYNKGPIGKHTVFIPAQAMVPYTPQGPSVGYVDETGEKFYLYGLDFNPSTPNEYATFAFIAPKSLKVSDGFKYRLFWTDGATAGTGDVNWALEILAADDDDDLSTAMGTTIAVTDSFIASGDLHITEESATVTPGAAVAFAKGDLVILNFHRRAGNVNDTYTQDARLLGAEVTFETDAAEDT